MTVETPTPASGVHIATIAHAGRLWGVWLEFADDPHRPDIYRGRLRYDPADAGEGEEPRRTTTIIIEESYEAAVERARNMDEHQLAGLLRSCLPDDV